MEKEAERPAVSSGGNGQTLASCHGTDSGCGREADISPRDGVPLLGVDDLFEDAAATLGDGGRGPMGEGSGIRGEEGQGVESVMPATTERRWPTMNQTARTPAAISVDGTRGTTTGMREVGTRRWDVRVSPKAFMSANFMNAETRSVLARATRTRADAEATSDRHRGVCGDRARRLV